MSLRFAALGSGSRGNALVVESGDTLLLVDCGLPRREIERRLETLGRRASDVKAVLITHEHGDHRQGLGPFSRRYPVPVWLTPGTASAVEPVASRRALNCHRAFSIGAITIEPYPVPHDAREPCQFVFAAAGRRLGLLTDSGHVTAHITERLGGVDALALEFNHDTDALEASAYPDALKARVASRFGHLSNAQSTGLLERLDGGRLQWVAGLHLSENTNSPELVRRGYAAAGLDERCPLHLAAQDVPSAWLEIL